MNGAGLGLLVLLMGMSVASGAEVKESAGKRPLTFEPNLGQTDAQVKYVARARGYTVYLTADEVVLAIQGSAQGVVRMKMRHSRPAASIEAGDPQIGKSNYIRPSGNIMGVPNYGKVAYKGIYPGIDVAYFGNQHDLEYDFVVRPGADPRQIRLAYEGSSRLALDGDGNLEIETAAGKALAHKPVVYQTVRGVRKPVRGEYVLMANNEVGFKLGAYDHRQALVIDPTLNVLAFLGGSAEDDAWGIATSQAGSPELNFDYGGPIYLTGRTASLNFLGAATDAHSPANNFDAFIATVQAPGTTMLYTTYLGGAGDQAGEGVVMDAAGNSYVTGYTNQSMTSTAPVAGSNPIGVYSAFLAKFSAAGALTAITYFGGAGVTQAFAIAIDPNSGNLVIGGLTNGLAGSNGEFRTFGGGVTDGFLASFDSSLVLQASTYLGGGNYDQVNSVAVDSSGNVYAAGVTASGNSALPAGFPTGSTLGFDALGLPNPTFITSPAVPAIPVGTVASGQQTAFVAKYNSALTQRRYSSIFGAGGETANGIAVDSAGTAYVVGATRSIYFDPGANQPGGGIVSAQPGSLPNTPTRFGNAVTGTLSGPFAMNAYPSPTQGFLLSLTAGNLGVGQGQVNYVALQTQGATDPNVSGSCNLDLPRFAGALGGMPSPCAGLTQSWNGIAVDSDQQPYIAGQRINTNGFYAAEIVRASNGSLAGSPQVATFDGGASLASTQAFAITVGPPRLAYFDGIASGPAGLTPSNLNPFSAPIGFTGTTQAGINIPSTQANRNPGPFPASAAKADASTDGLFGVIQFLDVFAMPNAVVSPPVGLFTPTGNGGPIETVYLFNQLPDTAWTPNTCAGGAINGHAIVANSPVTVGPFTVTQVVNTYTFQIELASGATNTAGPLGPATAFISCPGSDNASAITITGAVLAPSSNVVVVGANLTSISVLGSGILMPYSTTTDSILAGGNLIQTVPNQNPVQIPVAVFLQATAYQDYTVSIQGQSTNFPACALLGLSSIYSGTVLAPQAGTSGNIVGAARPLGLGMNPTYANGGYFAVLINAACAATLAEGTYTANVVVNTSGTYNALQFSLTIPTGATYGGNFELDFLSNTSTPQEIAYLASGQVPPVAYQTLYSPAVAPTNPLPIGNAWAASGSYGTTSAGPTTVVIEVDPAGLAPGVYVGSFQTQTVPTSQMLAETRITVTVGNGQTSLVNRIPASPNPVNITAPTGFQEANIYQPFGPSDPFQITSIGNFPNTPVTIGNTTGVSGVTAPTITTPANFPAGVRACFSNLTVAFTPQQPSCALQLAASQTGGTCPVFGPAPGQAIGAPWGVENCYYELTVDSTLLPTGTYSSTATFTATNGLTLAVPINLTVTAAPALALRVFTSTPLTALSFFGSAGQDATTCQNVNVGANGGTVTGVMVSTPNPFLAFTDAGGSPLPAFRAPSSRLIGTVTNSSTNTFSVCANPAGSLPPVAGFYSGTVNFASSGGAVTIPVTLSPPSVGAISPLHPEYPQQLAVFRNQTSGLGVFALDADENYNFDSPPDTFRFFGLNGDKPVAGDWFGTGAIEIGVFRCPAAGTGVCSWYIDANNNGVWDGVAGGDAIWSFGLPGDMPIVGDWTGDGVSKIGVMRCPQPGQGVCTWYLDAGNKHTYDPATVVIYNYGLPGDQPVANNWNAAGLADRIGVFRCPTAGVCSWIVDSAGTGASFTTYSYGVTGDNPIVGDWFSAGRKRIGVFRGGTVILNVSGTNAFVSGVDFIGSFGLAGDLPVIGLWTMP